MSTDDALWARLKPLIDACPRPVPVREDPEAPLASGQIRRLDPLPGDQRAHSTLVLLVSSPTPEDLPDDITHRPGPCHIVHAVVLDSGTKVDATVNDLILPTEATGTPFPLYALLDTLTTIRLPHDDPNGRTRFGPALGNTLPPEVADLAWDALNWDTDMLADQAATLLGWDVGLLLPLAGDDLWRERIRIVRNLNRLHDW